MRQMPCVINVVRRIDSPEVCILRELKCTLLDAADGGILTFTECMHRCSTKSAA